MKRLSAVVPEEEYRRVQKLVKAGVVGSVADLVRKAVREYAEKMGSVKLLSFREVSIEQARVEVEDYLKSHPGVVWPDEMAEELGLDYRMVFEIVNGLLERGKIAIEELKEKVEA